MTLKQRVSEMPKELQANWPRFRDALDAHLSSLTSEPSFIEGMSNEELGLTLKAVAKIRKNLQFSFDDKKPEKQVRLKSVLP